MTRLAAFLIALALAAPALAQSAYPPMLTGQKLSELCGARDQAKRFSCGYYVMGAIDTQLNNASLFGDNAKSKLCPPPNKTPEELVVVVRAYMEKHPDQLGRPAYELTWDALRGEFACR